MLVRASISACRSAPAHSQRSAAEIPSRSTTFHLDPPQIAQTPCTGTLIANLLPPTTYLLQPAPAPPRLPANRLTPILLIQPLLQRREVVQNRGRIHLPLAREPLQRI